MDDFKVYMNTWKNYNSYGADLSQYGIKNISDGWMTIDQAIEFAEKYAEDEPFINDVDNNTGLEIEVGEEGISKLQELKEMFEKFDELEEYDKEAVKAVIEANGCDIDEAIDIVERGDYHFIPDVSTDAELAEAVINELGGITYAVGEDRIDSYFDEEAWKRDAEDDILSDEELESYMDGILADEMSVAKYDNNNDFFESYFDYDAYGRDLSYDYTFVDGGAIWVF